MAKATDFTDPAFLVARVNCLCVFKLLTVGTGYRFGFCVVVADRAAIAAYDKGRGVKRFESMGACEGEDD